MSLVQSVHSEFRFASPLSLTVVMKTIHLTKFGAFLDLTSSELPPNHAMQHAGSDIDAAAHAAVKNAVHVNARPPRRSLSLSQRKHEAQ